MRYTMPIGGAYVTVNTGVAQTFPHTLMMSIDDHDGSGASEAHMTPEQAEDLACELRRAARLVRSTLHRRKAEHAALCAKLKADTDARLARVRKEVEARP
jgi:hypothetical protein